MLAVSLSLYERDGLIFSVSTLDVIPWKRPIQLGSYSVLSPNGTLTPTPKFHCGLRSMAKNMLGTKASLPASPPLPVKAALLPVPLALPLSENFVDGEMNEPPIAKCLPAPSRAMPAGFHQTVVASSAT